ncbi:Major facilitator superfamily transporter [Acididesulfobacillus acetoxydans]|uniref:Inner membrane transport protein YnfM n=1 Tax=Acididesulfobacillus acetoxydans TaxID=1561005 RepID=A0A8S0WDX4_9FIRM|nr:MFS transporter [Acididesulfobacillus acetoxydans]CAA7599652.1 Major facilitator superfamily transporter [Acididesulfobacillus acetoxydans]CEJ06204.1 Inner membrane transport protein YnfM [Acididesulfobacillus acetoxydans]
MTYIKRGTAAFRKANIALFFGGFNTFAIMYSTQPLLPDFSREFHISPAVASLSLSLTTIALAVGMLLVGSVSEVRGRKPIMIFSLVAASVLAVLTAFVPDYRDLLILRVLQGIVLAGLPAVAMAYLSEEIEPSSLGIAMGLYISGNSVGGMSGRIIIGMLTDYYGWRVALGSIGLLSVLASLLFWYLLPASRNFRARTLDLAKLSKSLLSHLKDPGLLCLYSVGFALMGSFVTLYNYIGFQLIIPPYSLSQALVGWIFILYLTGTFSSAWLGRLADKYGRQKMLGIGVLIMASGAVVTLGGPLVLKILGIAVFTFGFFGGHSVASGWVGRRAQHDKAQASSLYLFFYYAGSSIGGTAGGAFWSAWGWDGVIGMILMFLLLALFLSRQLRSIPPLTSRLGAKLEPRKAQG